jgi:hypothetical protein
LRLLTRLPKLSRYIFISYKHDLRSFDEKGDYKMADKNNKTYLLGYTQEEEEETLREKRSRAGKKGGLAPHQCRGRGCNAEDE